MSRRAQCWRPASTPDFSAREAAAPCLQAFSLLPTTQVSTTCLIGLRRGNGLSFLEMVALTISYSVLGAKLTLM